MTLAPRHLQGMETKKETPRTPHDENGAKSPAANIWPSGEKAKAVTVDMPAPQDTTLEGIAAARSQKTKPRGKPMACAQHGGGGKTKSIFGKRLEMRLNLIVKESLIHKRHCTKFDNQTSNKGNGNQGPEHPGPIILACETAVFTGEMFVFSVNSTM